MAEVIGINGHVSHQSRQPSQPLIETLQDWLDRAQAGELQGVAIASLFADNSAAWTIVGRVGGLQMLGALDMCKAELQAINMGDE